MVEDLPARSLLGPHCDILKMQEIAADAPEVILEGLGLCQTVVVAHRK